MPAFVVLAFEVLAFEITGSNKRRDRPRRSPILKQADYLIHAGTQATPGA